jgi:hypothetical protein
MTKLEQWHPNKWVSDRRNVDENGVHFGVIDFGDIKSDIIEEILWNSRNTRVEHIYKTMKEHIITKTLELIKEQGTQEHECETILNTAWENVIKELEDCGTLEECDNDVMTSSYEDVDMQWTVEDNEIFITKSPVTSMCRLCSPCAPNAGDLSTRGEGNVKTYDLLEEWRR